jgi:hypothetical protein
LDYVKHDFKQSDEPSNQMRMLSSKPMSLIDAIVEELKVLPPERLEQAAAFVHRLHQASQTERLEALRATSGTLMVAEADDWAKSVEDCERIQS